MVFLDYFEKEWCGSQRGWYCGLLSVPTNNNGLESTNRWFKNSISFKTGPRPRLDVLLLSVVEELKFISGQRAQHNEKAYQSQPRISLKLWRESLQYKEILAGRQLNNFFPRSNYPDPVTPEDIESYLNRSTCQDWSTFKSLTKLHQVTINSCDCRRFLEKRICIHIVARLIIEKKVSPPDEAYNFPLGQKLKPGRKKKFLSPHKGFNSLRRPYPLESKSRREFNSHMPLRYSNPFCNRCCFDGYGCLERAAEAQKTPYWWK